MDVGVDVDVDVGIGVGAYVYQGPDLLYGDAAFQDDVVATNLGVTAEVSFPLGAEQLRGRILGGLLNIGADDSRADTACAERHASGRVGFLSLRRVS